MQHSFFATQSCAVALLVLASCTSRADGQTDSLGMPTEPGSSPAGTAGTGPDAMQPGTDLPPDSTTPVNGPTTMPGADCAIPPEPSALVGWATQGGGTTGGGDATPVVVTTGAELQTAVGGSEPAVVHVFGSIQGSFEVGSNKTIIGTCDAEIRGSIEFNGAVNSILRNIRVVGFNCSDSPGDCSEGADAVGIQGMSERIWVDHVDVMDGSDGNLDVTQGATFVTVSWTRFSYSTARTDPLQGASGHRFSNLIGASDTDVRDPGRLDVTYHHCWWADNVHSRMPRTRRGRIHVFNSLYTSAGNDFCTNAGFEATLLVQNNVYIDVSDPLDVSDGGNLLAEGNVFDGTSGSDTDTGVGFTPPYTFSLDATDGLEAALRAGVGPQ